MATLGVARLVKHFANGVVGVDEVTLTVGDGAFTALVGPSGCGKTTILRCVAGLEEPTSGEVRIGGRDVTWLPPRDRDVAMVFQNYALYPHLSVGENIGFPLKVRKVAPAEAARRVRQAAELLEIGALLDRKPAQLSGGSASAPPWRARSCASPRSSFSTSRSPTSTRRCARRRAPNSWHCTGGSAPRCSTSRTTRWRR